jgi:hypothetical protein
VRDTGIVYQDIDSSLFGDLPKGGDHSRLVGDVTAVRGGRFGLARDFADYCGGLFLIHIENPRSGAIAREFEGNCAPDAASPARDHGSLSVKTELISNAVVFAQREMPRFQGMKSCWLFCSALV